MPYDARGFKTRSKWEVRLLWVVSLPLLLVSLPGAMLYGFAALYRKVTGKKPMGSQLYQPRSHDPGSA